VPAVENDLVSATSRSAAIGGWAPDYVDVMWRILQSDQPDDFVVASGVDNSLEELVTITFAALGCSQGYRLIRREEGHRIRTEEGHRARARNYAHCLARTHCRQESRHPVVIHAGAD
jgi:GDP-D-mannose dehydratase